ncbi:MAG: glycosyltransferase family 2 protein [Planctomycetota bacterium]
MWSIVVPAFNEEDSLAELHQRIVEHCGPSSEAFELILVDDGSTDSTWKVMQTLAGENENVIAVKLRRNSGKAAALHAGIAHTRGEIVITMDGDLQDDPKEITRFIEKLSEGYDVVSGWKQVRHDPWHKRYPSLVFNRLVSRLTGVELHDHNCGFKAYRREIFDDIELYGERHRFIPVLAASMGWRVGEIVVEHHARKHGHSKYGVSRILKGFFDLMSIYLMTGYRSRPLHLFGAVGAIFFALGLCGMMYLTIARIVTWTVAGLEPIHLHQTAVFYYSIFSTLLGGQFLLTGLLAELVVSRTSRGHHFYRIAEVVDSTSDKSKTNTAQRVV